MAGYGGLEAKLETAYPIETFQFVPIHHSDRGCQSANHEYVGKLKDRGISLSRTESGDPKDNAQDERVNSQPVFPDFPIFHCLGGAFRQGEKITKRKNLLHEELLIFHALKFSWFFNNTFINFLHSITPKNTNCKYFLTSVVNIF